MRAKAPQQSGFDGSVGWRLAAVREACGVSASRLARTVGVHRNTIRRIEDGECSMSFYLAIRICSALSISVEKLVPFHHILCTSLAKREKSCSVTSEQSPASSGRCAC